MAAFVLKYVSFTVSAPKIKMAAQMTDDGGWAKQRYRRAWLIR